MYRQCKVTLGKSVLTYPNDFVDGKSYTALR